LKRGSLHSQEERETQVIDYVLGDEEMREKVISLKIGERIDSDY